MKITDEMVERAADRWWEVDYDVSGIDFASLPAATTTYYRRRARAALEAALTEDDTEWEYTWGGSDMDGEGWVLDAAFASEDAALAFAGTPDGRWVKDNRGQLIRRRKAGTWEPVEVSE